MHFLQGKIEILAVDVLLYISLNLFLCHVTHLIVRNLNFIGKSYVATFSKNINVPPSRRQKVGFSALVQQEMGKRVDIFI